MSETKEAYEYRENVGGVQGGGNAREEFLMGQIEKRLPYAEREIATIISELRSQLDAREASVSQLQAIMAEKNQEISALRENLNAANEWKPSAIASLQLINSMQANANLGRLVGNMPENSCLIREKYQGGLGRARWRYIPDDDKTNFYTGDLAEEALSKAVSDGISG